jgi:AcrR family transcriptional regulator
VGRREENKRRTRHALLETGLVLFREHGFDETRVQDIVERVGVSPATFFNYFPTKDALLEAKAEQAADLYAALLRHELDRTDATVTDRLEQITRALAQALAADPAIARLLATRTALFFGSRGPKADTDRASQGLLADLFAQGQANDEIDPRADPLQLAELYTAALTLTATNWLINWWGDTNQSLEQRLLDALTILLHGARYQPEPP